ncbi:MAG: DUF2442 domain-containing protein [bacterium]
MLRENLERLRHEWDAFCGGYTSTTSVPVGWYPRLAHGTPAERANFKISGAGYGIHWPDLDEDIGVAGLLLGKKSTESPASFERWLQRRK